MGYNLLVGGWTNPFEKYARHIGSFPQVGVKMKNIWVATTEMKYWLVQFPESVSWFIIPIEMERINPYITNQRLIFIHSSPVYWW